MGDYTFTGRINGSDRLLVGRTIDPGFADIVAGDYGLAAGSICVDAAGRLPEAVGAYPVTAQFRPPVGAAPRLVVGVAADLGGFEFGAHVPADRPPAVVTPPVPPLPPPPAPPGPLVAPANLRAVATSSTSVRVEWLDRSRNETGFVVERWQPRIGWRVVGTVAANVTRFTDQGLRARTGYSYRVRAIDATGTISRLSAPTRAATAWTPAAVRGVRFGR